MQALVCTRLIQERFRDKISNLYPWDTEKTTIPSTSLLRSHMDTARHVVSCEKMDRGDAESLKRFWVCGKCFGSPKIQASKSPKCDFIKEISPDPLLISSQEDQIFVMTSPNSFTETELENMMRMESNLSTARKNGSKELINFDIQHSEEETKSTQFFLRRIMVRIKRMKVIRGEVQGTHDNF